MIKISKIERAELERVGLLRSRRTGYNACDANYTVVNREHLSRSKKTYVVEEPEIMIFLGHYEGQNLQRINISQYKQLWDKGLINRSNIQKWGTYVPGAIAFQDMNGRWRVKKQTNIMFELGIWSNNRPYGKYNRYNRFNNGNNETSNENSIENVEQEPTMEDVISYSNMSTDDFSKD